MFILDARVPNTRDQDQTGDMTLWDELNVMLFNFQVSHVQLRVQLQPVDIER